MTGPPAGNDLTRAGAAELARRIAAGEVSSTEAVAAAIGRIEAFDPRLNAVVVERFEEARAEAAESDRRRSRREALGPLHGVPITIKESHHLAGTPSTGGIPRRRGHRAEADGPLVRRLREAGAVVVGKTNVPELLLYLESDNPLYGRTANPWDPARSPGGSSGGEGAAVAAGFSALGLGTDVGGSIRVPAHVCGIHGLKPTSGRLTLVGTFDVELFPGQRSILAQPGPLARRVEDLVLALRTLLDGGPEMALPTFPAVPLGDPAAVRIEDLRVAWYDDDGFFRPAPALRRAVREAAAALAERGARVEEWRPPPVSEAMAVYFALLSADGAAWARTLMGPGRHDRRVRDLARLAGLPGALRPLAAGGLRLAGQRRLADLVRVLGRKSAAEVWRLVCRKESYMERFFGGFDTRGVAGGAEILLCPPSSHPALTHGASYYLNGVASYSIVPNVLGAPAGVVAATRVRAGEECDRPPSRDLVERTAREVERGSAGLPVGVQVVARHWREDQALAVMAALEEDFRRRPDYPVTPVEPPPGGAPPRARV